MNSINAIVKCTFLALFLCATTSHAVELVGKPVSSAESHSSPAAELTADEQRAENLSRVTNDSRDDIQKVLQDIGDEFKNTDVGDDLSLALLVPILAILMIFGGPLILIIVLAAFHYRAKTARQAAIDRNIDKLLAAGRDIPIELLRGGEILLDAGHENLHRGLRNIGIGVGLLIFLTLLCGIEIGAIGFIFIGLGASRVLIWWINGRKSLAVSVQE